MVKGYVDQGDLASDLGVRLKELRELVGMTQKAFAGLFGRGWKQASEWERGNQAPPVAVLERTARAMEWPLEMFLEGGRRPAEILGAPSLETTVASVRERDGPPYLPIAHSPESAIRQQVVHALVKRLYQEAGADDAVARDTAVKAIYELSDTWARWESTRSGESIVADDPASARGQQGTGE